MSDESWVVIESIRGHDGIKVASVVPPKSPRNDNSDHAEIFAQLQELKEAVAELRQDRTMLLRIVERLTRRRKPSVQRRPSLTGEEAKREFESIWAAIDESGEEA